jgi:hypothetical protein
LRAEAALALKSRAAAPWAAAVPLDIWKNYVLPYASLDEPRESWRPMFAKRVCCCSPHRRTAAHRLRGSAAAFARLPLTCLRTSHPVQAIRAARRRRGVAGRGGGSAEPQDLGHLGDLFQARPNPRDHGALSGHRSGLRLLHRPLHFFGQRLPRRGCAAPGRPPAAGRPHLRAAAGRSHAFRRQPTCRPHRCRCIRLTWRRPSSPQACRRAWSAPPTGW